MSKRLIFIFVFCFVISASTAQARPAGCPYAWCGCWLAQHLGISGATARTLWLARNWAVVFPRTSPAPGMVAVFARGKRGGHVGKIVAVHPHSITMISGNDGKAIRTRERSLRGLIAVVNPYSNYASSGGTKITKSVVKISYKKQKRRHYAQRYRPAATPALQYAHAAI